MNDIEKAIEQLKHDKENFEALLKEYKPSTIKERVESIIKSHILAIQALEKQLNGGWIPVSERLPEIDDYYLTTWQGYHSIEPVTRFNRFSCGRFEVDGIKAWQPLPEPFKEVEHETNNK